MQVIRTGIHKMLVRIANRKTLTRLLLQKQSDLGLGCLSRLLDLLNIVTVTIFYFFIYIQIFNNLHNQRTRI